MVFCLAKFVVGQRGQDVAVSRDAITGAPSGRLQEGAKSYVKENSTHPPLEWAGMVRLRMSSRHNNRPAEALRQHCILCSHKTTGKRRWASLQFRYARTRGR